MEMASSMIDSADYDAAAQTLIITFKKRGAVFEYANVPEHIYSGLSSAESAGKFFHSHIKGKYVTNKIN